MKRKSLPLLLMLAVGIAIGFLADRFVHAQGTTDQPELMTVDLDGSPGKEARMSIRVIAPGERTNKHYHPGDMMAYVLEGTVIHTVEGKAPVTFTAGQAFHETAKEIHFGTNPSNSVPVKILSVQIRDKGQPATIVVK